MFYALGETPKADARVHNLLAVHQFAARRCISAPPRLNEREKLFPRQLVMDLVRGNPIVPAVTYSMRMDEA